MSGISAFPSWWADKWRDLPLIGGASELPSADGDLAQLEELRDRIELAAATLTVPELLQAVNYIQVCSGSIERDTIMACPELLLAPWPDDARLLLDAWKTHRQEAA